MRGIFELDVLRDDSGNAVVVTGATVTVTIEGTGVPAELYDDITGISGPGNPFTVTGSTISFYADQDNRYRIDIVSGSFSRTLRYRDVTIDVTDIQDYVDSSVATHSADVDNVHGIASGDAVESVSGAQAKADSVQTNLTTHIASATPHPNLTLDFDKINYPTSYKIGDPTHLDNLLKFASHSWSAGITHGCEITDNGDGTVDIDSGFALLRATTDAHLPLYSIEVSAQAGISLTDQSENYVSYDFNGGTPQWEVSTSVSSFNCIDKCIGYTIYRDGTNLNIIDAREQNVDSNRKSRILFLEFQKFIHAAGGTSLGGNGLAITVTAGGFYFMLEKLTHDAFDTSVAGTANANVFTLWYRDGVGGWIETIEEKTIDSATYDNDTGTPVAIGNNKYGVSWAYIVHNVPSSLHVVMGQTDYSTVSDAEAASPPVELPGLIGAHGTLIGFVVYLKNDTAFTETLSAFTQLFSASAATTHNGLSGLQGGQVNEYYHLTAAEYTAYGYHTRARSIAAPNATVPAHSITAAGAETDIDAVFSPKGTGAILAQAPDGTASGGNKRGTYAVDLQRTRVNATEVASGISSFSIGSGNEASGNYSFSGGLNGSSIGVGAFSYGNAVNVINNYSFGSGSQITITGAYSAGFGLNHNLSGNYTFAHGTGGATRGITSKYAHSSLTISGASSQYARTIQGTETTDATTTSLSSDTSAPSASNVEVLPDDHSYAITARVIARDTSTGDAADFEIKGTAKRGTGVATTAIVGIPTINIISADSGASSWDVDLVADTTLGAVKVEVTGATGNTIHWVTEFKTVEVG